MKYAAILLASLTLGACIATGRRSETCLIGVGAPFVFVGINGKPFGWCRR